MWSSTALRSRRFTQFKIQHPRVEAVSEDRTLLFGIGYYLKHIKVSVLARAGFQKDPEGWLKETIVEPEKKLAFFVGAGISVDSGLPNFFKFSSDFIGSICPSSLKKSDIDEICQRLRPEVLLQVVQQIHKDRTMDFYSSLESELPNANHFFLALALKAGHCVFTTNVDTLIEQACKKLELPCNPIVHENEYKHFLKKQSKGDSGIDFKSQLFKLHGSIESDKVGLKKYESIRFVLDRVGLGLTESQEIDFFSMPAGL